MFINENTTKSDALVCAARNGWVVRFLKEELKNDLDVAMAAVKNNGKVLKELGSNIKKNKNIIIEACKTFPNAYVFACPTIKNEPEIVALRKKDSK